MKTKKIFGRNFIELTGSIHIHTKYSYDSEAEPSEIIDAANYNKLDYMLISDHLNNNAKDDKIFKNEKRIKIIVGTELNDKDEYHHYLVFGKDKIELFDEIEKYTNFYFGKDTATFVAHPFDKRATEKFKKYTWNKTDIIDFDGIEIWNAVSDWITHLKPSLNGFFYVFFPSFFIKSADKDAIKWWDEINNRGIKKSAIGSADAHTFPYKKFGINFKFLTHKYLFGTVRTNILIVQKTHITEDDILLALKKGNSYVINYKVGYPEGFYAGISKRDANSAIFGEEIPFEEGLYYYYRSPYLVKAVLYKNGKKIAVHTDNKGAFKIESVGNYRLELSRNLKKWIYTNNIYVK